MLKWTVGSDLVTVITLRALAGDSSLAPWLSVFQKGDTPECFELLQDVSVPEMAKPCTSMSACGVGVSG